jgi:nitrogen-specific signal transduction histidine kinase
MWRRVDIVLTDVSEECITSIFMVEKKENPQARNQHEQLLISLSAAAHAGSSLADFLFSSTLKLEAIRSSETSVNTISARRHIP